ncbi:MAG TPA: GxxExxY protein [Desulfonatronum sp.]|nr:GxxExxY protein [Desulfonatronum sp.]
MNRAFSQLSKRVIGCAVEVHRVLGPGLLESTYQQCLAREFDVNNIRYVWAHPLAVEYKGIFLDCAYRIDFFVEDAIILKLKAVEALLKIHEIQLLTYLKLSGAKQGLLLNFNVEQLKLGVESFVL